MVSITKRIGIIGELAIAQDLVVRGFDVFTSIGDNSKVDLVALRKTQTFRIQVKTVKRVTSVVPVVGLKYVARKHVLYNTADVDVIAIYVIEQRIIAYVPMHELMT